MCCAFGAGIGRASGPERHIGRLPPPRCITTARPPTVVLIILNFGVRLRLSIKGQQSSSLLLQTLLLQTLQLHTPQFM